LLCVFIVLIATIHLIGQHSLSCLRARLSELVDADVARRVFPTLLSFIIFSRHDSIRFLAYALDFPNWSNGFRNSGVRAGFFRAVGEMNFYNLGYVMFPVARNSIWQRLLGTSFERSLRLHRMLGRFTVMVMMIHGIGTSFWNAVCK
jgi:hypothetical protein